MFKSSLIICKSTIIIAIKESNFIKETDIVRIHQKKYRVAVNQEEYLKLMGNQKRFIKTDEPINCGDLVELDTIKVDSRNLFRATDSKDRNNLVSVERIR